MSKKFQMNRRRFLQTSMTPVVGTGMISCSDYYRKRQDTQDKKLKIKEYRTLGRTGFKVSDIGYGTGDLTDAEVFAVALDLGVNYIDTAEHYMNGQSERTIGEVIKKRDRKSIFITTKLNLTMRGDGTKEDIKQRFRKCMERLQTDYVDCLMIHMVSTVEQVKHEGFHQAVQELKDEGKVRFTGLSNHGLEHRIYGNIKDPMEKVILAAAEDGRFDVVLMVYNFLQKDQGEKIIETCKKKNMGITLMKTDPVNEYLRRKGEIEKRVKEGQQYSERVVKMMEEFKTWLNQAEAFKNKYGLKNNEQVRNAAIKFCLSHPGVHSVCATINSFDELETFVALSGKKLESSDNSMLEDYKSTFGRLYCRHACGICETACPYNIPVNTIMRYNHYFQARGKEKHAILKYANLSKVNAERCQDCSGHCVSVCPYHVPIKELLMLAHQNLTLV